MSGKLRPIRGAAALFLSAGFAGAATPELWQISPPLPELAPSTLSGPVHVNDIEMWQAEFGSVIGKPLVMVHGAPASSDDLAEVIPYLVDAGLHVVHVDSRGHGRSTRSAQPYSYEVMESDVVGMVDALHIQKADLVSWSDGEIIGIVLALRHPDRPDRVLAFGANTDSDGFKPDFDKEGVFKMHEDRAGLTHRALSPTPDQYDTFLKKISEIWATQPHLTEAQLHAVHVPIVIADGRYDEGIKQSHDGYMSAAIPNAHLGMLPRCRILRCCRTRRCSRAPCWMRSGPIRTTKFLKLASASPARPRSRAAMSAGASTS